jgi:hypothetical protein
LFYAWGSCKKGWFEGGDGELSIFIAMTEELFLLIVALATGSLFSFEGYFMCALLHEIEMIRNCQLFGERQAFIPFGCTIGKLRNYVRGPETGDKMGGGQIKVRP